MSFLLYFTYNFAVSYKTNCTHSIFRTIKARASLAQRIVKWQQHETFSYREFTFGRYCSVRSMCHYVVRRVIIGFSKNFQKILFSPISKITLPANHFWILQSAKLASELLGVWMKANEQFVHGNRVVLQNKRSTYLS